MVTTLILIRHGKAERAGFGQPDIDRSLTPGGIEALAGPDGFTRTLAQLADPERAEAEVWVSPALRARQTAAEAVRVIGERDLIEHESIWEQDLGLFFDELDASDASTVIAVGHIPFMNEAAAWLTGEPVSFSPGSVAAISLPEGPAASQANGTGKLLWFAPGPKA